MLKKFLESFKDPQRPLLGPNYWILEKMGLLLPENRAAKYAYIFLHEVVTFFVVTQYMELYVIRSNLDLVLTNLKISMLSIVCVVKANTFVFWQAHWKQVIQYVNEADKYERDTRDRAKGKILDTYTKYCRRLLYFYWVLVLSTFATVTTAPLVRYLTSENFRKEIQYGIELFPHIFSSWMPFDKYHSPGSWITVLWHTVLCAYGAGSMAAYDTTAVIIMVFFGGKLELLRERCKQMLGSNGLSISDKSAGENISELHKTHLLLMKHSKLFNSLLSPVMFFYFVMCSLMLCASAFQLTTATSTAQKLIMAEYFVFGIAQLFIFCWHSNDVLAKNEKVMFGPYESQWWAASARQRKSVLMFASQLRLVHTYTAGPFTKLTLSEFITILKGSYTYYALLRK